MNSVLRVARVTREAALSAWNQRAASLLTVCVVLATALTILLTTGRTVGAERAVLASIDDAGTRTVTFRSTGGAGIDAQVVERIATLGEVEWVVGFGPAVDVTNIQNPEGPRVTLRAVYATNLEPLIGPQAVSLTPTEVWAWGDDTSRIQLGLPERGGRRPGSGRQRLRLGR